MGVSNRPSSPGECRHSPSLIHGRISRLIDRGIADDERNTDESFAVPELTAGR